MDRPDSAPPRPPVPAAAAGWVHVLAERHPEMLRTVEVAAGAALFHEGAPPDALYVVAEGTLSVQRSRSGGAEVARLVPGDVLGEMGLLTGRPRSATVAAVGPARVLRLSAEDYEAVREADPEVESRLAQRAVPRWQRDLLATGLRRLLGEAGDAAARELRDRLVWRTLASGDVLCRQGEPGDALYVVVSGRVLFEVEEGGVARTVGEARAGETVGEFSLLTDAPRSATVVAARRTVAVEVERELFAELVGAHPEMLFAIARQVAERQRHVHRHGSAALPSRKLTVCLVPVDPALDVHPLARDLVSTIGRDGPARLLDAAAADAALGAGAASTTDDAPRHAALVQWLNEQEAEADTLVFVPGPPGAPWADRCLSRSDVVLFVARPDGDPALSPAERVLARGDARAHRALVMWHPPETDRPARTARWLDGRESYDLHHLREGDAGHVARLARRLAGNAIGLVLSGGGARGYAHFGVVRALEESGVPLDAVGGASFGALVAALVAHGIGPDEILAQEATLADNRKIFDRTIPVVAMNASHRLTETCRSLFGDAQIEDLWVPFFAVAVNLTRGETVTIRRGPLWRAVRTSIAVPGVFTPMVSDGEVFIDGGVMNNFPVDVMADAIGSERTIGVDLTVAAKRGRTVDIGPGLSGWRALLSRLRPRRSRPRIPLLSGVLMQTLFVGSKPRSAENAERADLCLSVELPRVSFLDFRPLGAVSQMGYDQAIGPVRAWAAAQPDLRTVEPGEGGAAPGLAA